MSSLLHSLTGLLSALPPGGLLLFAGALVFVEDALFLGFLIPGETAALMAGAAAGAGRVPVLAALAVVLAAAVAGDAVGFLIGRRFGTRLLGHPRLRRHRATLARTERRILRHGGPAVLAGRWTAILRAVTPAVAGAFGMPYRRFAIWNLLGGVLWSSVVVGLGYAAGTSYQAAATSLGHGVALLAAGVALVVLGRVVLGRRRHGADAAELRKVRPL